MLQVHVRRLIAPVPARLRVPVANTVRVRFRERWRDEGGRRAMPLVAATST